MTLKKVTEGIWMWSWMSPEKGYFFNGTLVSDGKKRVLIDPVFMDGSLLAQIESHGAFDAIYLSNKDHERMAYDLRKKWKTPIAVHEHDETLLRERADFTFRDGQDLLCGLKVIHLREQKSPGECAFYLTDRKILIVGDALIGHPSGSLNMLPDVKYADVRKAQAGLRRIFSIHFETLLVGDGEFISENAYRKVEEYFERHC